MKIQRDRLLRQLEAFVLTGSGIVVGLPGAGKTYSFGELYGRLESSGKRRTYIPIDKLDIESEDDLRSELGIDDDLVSYLKDEALSPEEAPGVLLIDAFDAARSTKAQRTLSRLIGSVRRELAGSWNVVVSVRTYDARKSQELQELFPSCSDDAPPDDFQLDGIRCRHFCIPELSDDEVQEALTSIRLPEILGEPSSEFAKLLRVPFNLWLLEQLLCDGADIPGLTSVASEVQLLGLYWRHRVLRGPNAEGKRVLLARTASALISQNSLSVSVREKDVFDFSAEAVWNLLFSAGILTYTSPSEQRVAFSHNILFDYAVSVLLIEDDPEQLVSFLSADASRPLFLRPSLVYYLTRLWYDAPDVFWRVFWHILPWNNDVHVRLFARNLPPAIIVSEARNIGQLVPLVDALQKDQPDAGEAVLRLLQAIAVSGGRHDAIWASLLERISSHIDRQFAWNAASLATEISKRAERDNSEAIFAACGQVGRDLAAWLWSQQDRAQNSWLNNVGGHWIMPLVARTYPTNVAESRAMLEPILGLIGEDSSSVELLYGLVREIETVYPADPEFAAEVYERAFTYYEMSNETTHMGGRVIAFTSTLRQDYGMCQHRLIEHFPKFLRSAPVPATRAVVRALNCHIVRSHIADHLKERATLEDLVRLFQFEGSTVHYLVDMSCIWDSTPHHDDPTKLADALFEYISELAKEGRREQIALIVCVIRDDAQVAFFWRRLLEVATRFPDVFVDLLSDLLVARPLQTEIDTEYQLGEFLEAVSPILSPSRLIEVEASILGIPGEASGKKRKHMTKCRDKLLARIPKELLTTASGKRIRKKMETTGTVPENRQPLTWHGTTGEPYTHEMWLDEQGVDRAKPEHASLLVFSKPLDSFNTKWLNERPTPEAISAEMSAAKEAYDVLRSTQGADAVVQESMLTKLGTFAHTVSRAVTDLDDAQFAFCRDVLLTCASHDSPKPDPEQNFDFPAWSPAPRIEAAEGLPWLAAHKPDDDMLEAVRVIARDPVPAVRFSLQMELWRIFPKSPVVFWDIVEERAKHEENHVVANPMLNSLSYVIAKEEGKTAAVLAQLTDRILADADNGRHTEVKGANVLREMAHLVVWLVLLRRNTWAQRFMDSLLSFPVRFAEVIDELASIILGQYVFPGDDTAKDDIVDIAMPLVVRSISAASDGIAELRTIPQDEWNDDLTSRMRATYDIIDHAVRQLHFALRVDDPSSKRRRKPKDHDETARLYPMISPVLDHILLLAADESRGLMFASTAQTFMEILNHVLDHDPARVLRMANQVVQSSRQSEYYLDSMAIREVVTLVEAILADHREVVRQGDPLMDLLSLLDTFADVGWAEALNLVWRLDEVFR